MKYATLDNNNQPTAFYSDETHGARLIPDPAFVAPKNAPMKQAPMVPNPTTKIPAAAVMIPDAIWQRAIDGTKQVYDQTTKTWSDYVPTKSETLAAARATKLAAIIASYAKSSNSNITVSLLKADFQADASSRMKIDACINRLNNGWKPPVGADVWLDTVNGTHQITLANMNAIADTIATREADLFARLQTAKTGIAAAKTVKTINAVTI